MSLCQEFLNARKELLAEEAKGLGLCILRFMMKTTARVVLNSRMQVD